MSKFELTVRLTSGDRVLVESTLPVESAAETVVALRNIAKAVAALERQPIEDAVTGVAAAQAVKPRRRKAGT